jgi:lipopolysaccharide transport system ATP-binding protein
MGPRVVSDTVIKIQNLSKHYRIGRREGYRTFRETLLDAAKAPFQRIARLNPKSQIRDMQSETIWALKNVSLEAKRGEVVGIIGRNGAGKTTLLKILSKITLPTEGRVELRGRVGSLLEVGTGFHPELTGHENVYLYGAILGMDRREVTTKFDEIIEFAELEKFTDTPVKRYSTGMYMRLAFAVAAHLEPEILLVDEVLAVGDASFQKKCLGKMGKVAGEGRTIIFVSHNIAAIEALCSRCLILDSGTLTFIGDTSKATTKYLKDNLSLEYVPLKERTDREGLGNAKINAIRISAPQGLATGKTITVLANYESKRGIEIKEFGLSIWTDRELKLISLSTEFSRGLENIPPQGIVSCTIPELPLVKGNYMLNFFVSSTKGIEDYIINALPFHIDDSDFFGTGKSVDPKWGAIAVRHEWGLKDIHDTTIR